jgi:uncharacterized protein YqfA (UPF0365 family)
MPNMISTCGADMILPCGAAPTSYSIVDRLGEAIVSAGQNYLANLAQIEAAKAQQKITEAQAQALAAQARAAKEQADADFKKKLPLYIGGGVAALALLYFFTRRR